MTALGDGPGDQPPAAVEKLLKAYCSKHGLARDKLEPWKSVLAPEGRVFRYKLPAFPADEKRGELYERYAFVFVDAEAGNVYDVKRVPGGETTVEERAWAVMRLMGTKVRDDKQARAMMADLYRMRHCLSYLTYLAKDEKVTVDLLETRTEDIGPVDAKAYWGDPHDGVRLWLHVDREGYVTRFYMVGLR
jgi:hypothetical protein